MRCHAWKEPDEATKPLTDLEFRVAERVQWYQLERQTFEERKERILGLFDDQPRPDLVSVWV